MIQTFKRQPKIFWWILLGSAALRLAGLARPLLGNFSSVQVIYAMMAKNFRDLDWNLFVPRLDILAGGEPGIRLLDLPLISYGAALLSVLTSAPVDLLGRGLSAGFSLAAAAVWFHFLKRRFSETAALAAMFFFSFAPLTIIYGQSFQTDAASLCLFLFAIDRLQSAAVRPLALIFSAGCMALVLLMRIQYVFLFPLALYFFWEQGQGLLRSLQKMTVWGALAVLPLLGWNFYIYHFTAAHPDTVIMSIFHQLKTGTYAGYRPWSPFFLSHSAAHFFQLLLNPLGAGLCLIGLFSRNQSKHENGLRLWFFLWAGMLAVLSKKAVDMNYYWLGLCLPASFFAAKGLILCAARLRRGTPGRGFLFFLAGISLIFSLRYAAGAAYKTPAEDASVIEAGRYIQEHSGKEDRIIAANGTNLNLLYYAGRKGWAFPILDRAEASASPYGAFTLQGQPLSAAKQAFLKAQTHAVAALEYYREQGARYFVCVRMQDLTQSVAGQELKAHLDRHYTKKIEQAQFIVYEL